MLAQDCVNLHISFTIEDTFSLDTAHITLTEVRKSGSRPREIIKSMNCRIKLEANYFYIDK